MGQQLGPQGDRKLDDVTKQESKWIWLWKPKYFKFLENSFWI